MGKIETKVIAAFAGSGIAAATGQLILWLLAIFVWHQPNTAKAATDAVSAVPEPVATWILIALAGIGAFLGGYFAPHTVRVDLNTETSTDQNDAIETAPVDTAPPAATPAEPEAPAAGVPPAAPADGTTGPGEVADLMLHAG